MQMLPSSAGTSESSKAQIKQADYSTLMKKDFFMPQFLCLSHTLTAVHSARLIF